MTRFVALLIAAVLAAGCGTGERPVLETSAEAGESGTVGTTSSPDAGRGADQTATTPTTEATTTTIAPGTPEPAPDGRRRPVPGNDAVTIATQIVGAEQALRNPTTDPSLLPDLGHLLQVAYRRLGGHPEWDAEVLAATPAELVTAVEHNIGVRRELRQLGHGEPSENVPAWALIAPEPIEDLQAHYLEAESLTGIDWEYLAAINLIETVMGRIDGLSTAGAQGPMQFLPTTWEEVGEGSIDDPRDAIIGAGRYLVRRGGPADMDRALFGYNNSEHYVAAVTHAADVLRDDPAALVGYYHFEVHYVGAAGDLWLPTGTVIAEVTPAIDFIAENPWVAEPAADAPPTIPVVGSSR